MTTPRYSDIVLDEADLAYIEARIGEYNLRVYSGEMDARGKSILRQQLIKDTKENIWQSRDFVEGFDSGEPQTTPDFNHYNGVE